MRLLAGNNPLLDERIETGRIVDGGPGDPPPEDIFCLPEGPQILDRLEFDNRLRRGEGLDDVAPTCP